ncbi:hypothetical protein SAMN05421640_3677 [Ekhidna lutea]|uniref:Outer membrane protein beta-barrel domain-containing protein n=1 Tax=Ekhidna lutea TaxID=447679 RepID=A0A239M7C6_EKHLU|nr:hypothetical protein [Ekhidna lutea]SNT38350.1 hypothetical protein SAMN05421640_3677 [Ekhidna lutea]
MINFSYIKHGFSLFMFFISQALFSQKNYIEGIIITNSGDSIIGFIDYKNWDKNPLEINYKPNLQKESISYNPSQVKEFRVGGDTYISAYIDREISSVKVDELERNSVLNLVSDSVFLRVLISGKKSLYIYKHENGKANFYIKTDKIELLKYKRYYVTENRNNYALESKIYLNQLDQYLNECDQNMKLSNTKYQQNSLIKLFTIYYENCLGVQVKTETKSKDKLINSGVLAGITLSSLEFKSSSNRRYTQMDSESSVDPVVGGFLELILPRTREKWSVNNELLITTYSIAGEYIDYTNEQDYRIINSDFNFSYLKLNTLVRYYILHNPNIYLESGITNSLMISSTNTSQHNIQFYSTSRQYDEPAIESIKSYEFGTAFGLGLRSGKLGYLLRYEYTNGMSGHQTLQSRVSRYYFMVSYKL